LQLIMKKKAILITCCITTVLLCLGQTYNVTCYHSSIIQSIEDSSSIVIERIILHNGSWKEFTLDSQLPSVKIIIGSDIVQYHGIITFTMRVGNNCTSGVEFAVYDSIREKWDDRTANWEFQVNPGQEINTTFTCVAGKNSDNLAPGDMTWNCSLTTTDGNASVSILYSIINMGDNGPPLEGLYIPGLLFPHIIIGIFFIRIVIRRKQHSFVLS